MEIRQVHDNEGIAHSVRIYRAEEFPASFLLGIKQIRTRNGRLLDCAATFDIECWTDDKLDTPQAYMYHWQFCIMRRDYEYLVVMGDTWEQFQTLEKKLWEYSGGAKPVIYVHNLGYEFQFMKHFLHIENMFARKVNVPIYFTTDHAEYRCSWMLSNMSLSKFCQNSKGCTFWKKTDTYDYRAKRVPGESVSDSDFEYDFCDVVGLCQCIIARLQDDNISTIPLTSTGYVRRQFRKTRDAAVIKECAINADVYKMCRKAFRGGDVHYNHCYGIDVIENVHSYDKKSSYPYQIICKKYPMTRFTPVKPCIESINRALEKNYAFLVTIRCFNIQVKNLDTIAYMDKGHCRNVIKPVIDNGRILYAQELTYTMTDIDYQIVSESYNIESIEIQEIQIAKYGYLPLELRKKVAEMFIQKCYLEYDRDNAKNDIESEEISYLYSKKKNEFNSTYGMMVQDPCADEIILNELYEMEKIPHGDVAEILQKYYENSKSFLTYQWGVWVTAHARADLRETITEIGRDTVYVDSDCNKHIGDHAALFERINDRIKQELHALPFPAVPEINGHKFYIGTWEKEHDYEKFKSLGAKKYCGIVDGKLQITVAGLNKKKGAAELERSGGIYAFRIGKVFRDSGRTTAYYNEGMPHTITVDGVSFTTASNIGIVDTTYTLGVTDDYGAILFGDIEEFTE